MNAIETHRLTKRFRRLGTYRDLLLYRLRPAEHLAVDDLTFNVERGELFGLLGENGAGKSTVIRMLSTTLLPTSGIAMVGGHDVVRAPNRVRELVGVASGDERSFYWRLSGRQNLEFFAALYHLAPPLARQRIDSLLDVFGIREEAEAPFYSYSTGIRHKFSIARGLLTEPQILFLDEPTRSLDPIAAADVRQLLVDHVVGEMGHTVLLATHSLSEAEAICGRIGIIQAGRLVACGTIAELRQRMTLSTSFEIRVTGRTDDLFAGLERVQGVDGIAAKVDGTATRFTLWLGRDPGTLNRVLTHIIESGANVESCEIREPALEEIYRRALGAGEVSDMLGGRA
jgi:ABC-2 type transport system ATP-binding protein